MHCAFEIQEGSEQGKQALLQRQFFFFGGGSLASWLRAVGCEIRRRKSERELKWYSVSSIARKKKKAGQRTSTYKDAGTRNNSTFFFGLCDFFEHSSPLLHERNWRSSGSTQTHTHTHFFVIVRDAL